MAAKTVNYTPEMTEVIVAAYQAAPTAETVEALAAQFSKTVKSIVAKLSREGVYQKKEYVSKTGEKPVEKEAFATFIGEALGMDEASTSSLAKANKKALATIKAFIEEAQKA